MSIVGSTFGMGLPKPDLMQTDPRKGDYVKGKEEFVKQFEGAIRAPETAEVGQTIVVKAVDENGRPVEWEAVGFPKCEQVQVDLNQNDETAPDYVKGRTHWVEEVRVQHVCVPETATHIDNLEKSAYFYESDVECIEAGKTYTVRLNGNDYERVGRVVNVNEIWLGDNDPFTIVWHNKRYYLAAVEAGDYTVSITRTDVRDEYIQLDEKFIPDTIARVSDVFQSQPNLAENDESAPGYISGRTHWVENKVISRTELLFECEFESTPDGNANPGPVMSTMTVGATYTVTFDGIPYECVAINDGGWITLGNFALYDPEYNNSSEPFIFSIYNPPYGTPYITVSEPGVHTISIAEEVRESVYHTLDEKFIPDTIVRKADVAEEVRTVMTSGDAEIFLTSTGGKKFAITVTDDGTITATEITG